MASPSSSAELLELVQKSGLVEEKRLAAYADKLRAENALPPDAKALAARLIADGLLTHFQAEQILQGKWRRFNIGKYKVLEKLGAGGMGSVFLCEHKIMRRLVAIKVLPTAKANDPSSLERFQRESRAVGALDHPNIVRAHDIDEDDKLHFLVMEYVDGASLQDIVKKTRQMDYTRAAHYIRQAALGLQHAHETAGLVHRDVKPGNVLVDRNGVVKLLDLGLARFFHDEEDMLTKKYDENVLGTADYLAPEQATDSHSVDIRADIYSLGATFYFCLTGRTPFAEGTVAQKLIWHQTRMPKPIRGFRPDVPDELIAVIEKAMAKDPAQRYQLPIEFAAALNPWTQEPIGPPPDVEMPQLAPILKRSGLAPDSNPAIVRGSEVAGEPPSSRKVWQVPGCTPSPRPHAKPGPPPIAGPSPARPKTPPAGKVPGRVPVPPPTVVKRTAKQIADANGRPRLAPTKQAVVTEEPDAIADAETSPGIHAVTTPPIGSKRKIAVPKLAAPPTMLGDKPVLFWCLVAAAVVLAVLILTGTVWLANRAFGAAGPATGTPNPPLYVGGTNGLTIEQALARARANDRIVLQEDISASGVAVTWPNLTIESAPGQTWTWHAPKNTDASATLMIVDNVEGLAVKNLKFDGENRAGTLIQVRGKCPDLKLQDLTLMQFTNCGLRVTSAEGTEHRPIHFTRLEINHRGRGAQLDMLFDLDLPADGTRPNQFFHISECKSANGQLVVNGRDTLRNVQPADFAKNP